MSKKSKKTKFNKVEVQWAEDDKMLPTVAAAIPQRRDRGFGGPRSYGNSPYAAKEFDDTERGPWRRGPSSASATTTTSPPNNLNRNSRGPSSFNSFRSSDNSNFRSSDNSNFRSTDNSDSNRNVPDFNASDNDKNWRFGKKKEQPKISLNSTISSSGTNINPWRNSNNNNLNNNKNNMNNDGDRDRDRDRGDRDQNNSNTFSRNSFGSRSAQSNGSSTFGSGSAKYGSESNNRYGSSKFGSGPSKFGSGPSKFGSGPSKFGSNSSKFSSGSSPSGIKSKFNTGGGFAASALKNIDSGTTRLTYSKNNRFSGIMDDNPVVKRDKVLEAPSKVSSSRFGASPPPSASAAPSTSTSNPQREGAFPGLMTANGMRRRKDKTVEEMVLEIKKENQRTNESEKQREKEREREKEKEREQLLLENKRKQKTGKQQKTNTTKQNTKKTKQSSKMDKKLIRKFNREYLGQNRAIELNQDTLKLITFGLSQKENILKRNEENYEKIARLLVGVILNSESGINLKHIYDIIYSKRNLFNDAPRECLALVLEILSLIEIKKTCLGVVFMVNQSNLVHKYLRLTPGICDEGTMKEFVEYGLQYVYPLNKEIISGMKQRIDDKVGLEGIVEYLDRLKGSFMIYSNYITLDLCINYVFNRYYFALCVETDEEKNENLAKLLINHDVEKKNKTHFRRMIELLQYKENGDGEGKDDDDDEEGEEEEDDDDVDDDINSHSLLILSSIINCCNNSNSSSNCGLVSMFKRMELSGLIEYNAIRQYVQCDDDSYTHNRLSALSKLTDWISGLDEKKARLDMEKAELDDDDDDALQNEYARNLLAQRKHKTAADYEQISYIDVE